jgi:hypothetical protein
MGRITIVRPEPELDMDRVAIYVNGEMLYDMKAYELGEDMKTVLNDTLSALGDTSTLVEEIDVYLTEDGEFKWPLTV